MVLPSKMYFVTFLAVISVCISESFPENTPNGCLVEGIPYKVGDSVPDESGSCRENRCLEDGSFGGRGCPYFPPQEGCVEVAGDVTKPWPNCCPTIQCPLKNN